MDRDSALFKAKWLLFAGFMVLIACYMSYTELVYLIRGREAQASVTQAFVAERGLRRTRPMLTVEYTFTEPDGTHRSDSDDVSPDWPLAGKSVAVQFTPGKDGRSRLKGHGSWWPFPILAISLGVLGFSAFRFWRRAAAATQRGKTTKR